MLPVLAPGGVLSSHAFVGIRGIQVAGVHEGGEGSRAKAEVHGQNHGG